MRRRTVILLTSLVLLVAAGFAGARIARPMARAGLGFVAKSICSNVFLGGMTQSQAHADLPDEPIARLVRTRIDTVAQRVTAAVPLVSRRTAAYRAGLGCTLTPFAEAAAASGAAPPIDASLPWPDGEAVATANITGVDRGRLDAVIADAFAEPDPARRRGTRAIVIVHGGRIIAERYADGFHAANRFTGWSMTKSVTNALVGILTADGTLELHAKALRPEWRTPGDPRAAITLHDLLQMSSGLGFDERYTPDGGATRMLFDAPDAAAVAATSPLAHTPGAYWSYSSATTNLVSALIREAVAPRMDYYAFPRQALFDRIGMSSAVLEPDPSGTFVGSSFMYATARDWARFGLLFLRDGEWNGERILPPGWVGYSVTPAAAAPLGQYGAHWWLNAGAPADSLRRTWPDLPRDVYYASGFEGQYVVVLPSQDLVVVRLGVTPDDRAWSPGAFLRAVLESMDQS